MGKDYKSEDLKDGGIMANRSCTDCCMIFVAMLFVAGWIVVAVVAFTLGRPSRILLPENFRGELCGDEGTPLEDYKYLFVPKPSRPTYGLCVPNQCPSPGDYICNNDLEPSFEDPSKLQYNHYYSHTADEFSRGFSYVQYCATGPCSNKTRASANRFLGMLERNRLYKCFFVFYHSGSTLRRCLPFQSDRDNATLADLAGESAETVKSLADFFGVSSFFTRGFGETRQSWLVILICGASACVISALWIFFLRCCMKPVIYLCILLIFVILCLIGWFAMTMADDLENVRLPGDTATENQVKVWRAIQYAAWILAGIYFVAMVYLIKRIKIAIQIMKEGSKAFLNNKSLIIIPPIIFVVTIGWIVWFIYVSLYIQTIGKVEKKDFQAAANNTFGSSTYNAVGDLANYTNRTLIANNITSANSTLNSSTWTTSEYVRIMHAYNFFGFLWASNFCIMYGFFVISMTTVVWYFSATTLELTLFNDGDKEGGRLKNAPVGTVCRAICAGLRYHLGTILWGSLLIAIIQFVRVLFLYIEEEFLSQWKDSVTVRCLVYCINCCLAYIERVVKIISANAFIVCAITSESFCSCAREAVSLLVNNAVRVGTLSTLSTVAYFIVKLFIVLSNMCFAYGMIQITELTGGTKVESGLFPLVFIFFMSMIIASLFVSVFESCTDTVMMSFLWDEEHLGKGKQETFMSPSLAKLADLFGGVEEARREYERRIREASDKQQPEANSGKIREKEKSTEPNSDKSS